MAEYINRKDAINGFVQMLKQSGDIYPTDITTMLQSIPLADVRPVVRGRWIPRDLTYGGDFYVCSVCDRTVDVPTAMWVPLFRFCPHCGSDMEDVDKYNPRSVAAIKEMKPADVRPVVRGQWVRHYCDDDGVPDGWSCDRCKEWYVFGPSKPNFCPNCGADMRSEKEDK